MAETDKIIFPCNYSFQFPIGYILMSASKINPATFLKYGEWELLGSGRTILGASDTDTGKETGGSFSKRLTISNIPAHTHSLPNHTHQIPAHTHNASSDNVDHTHTTTINNNGSHVHSIAEAGYHSHTTRNTKYSFLITNISSSSKIRVNESSTGSWIYASDTSKTAMDYTVITDSDGTHNHTIQSAGIHNHTASLSSVGHNHSISIDEKEAFNTQNGGSGTSGSYGSGTSFDITPSYIKLFIWERIG